MPGTVMSTTVVYWSSVCLVALDVAVRQGRQSWTSPCGDVAVRQGRLLHPGTAMSATVCLLVVCLPCRTATSRHGDVHDCLPVALLHPVRQGRQTTGRRQSRTSPPCRYVAVRQGRRTTGRRQDSRGHRRRAGT